MPIYEYEPKSGKCDQCPGRFEHQQKMSETPIKECPTCHQEVIKVMSAVSINTKSSGADLSDKNIAKHGFVKYKKSGDGEYEKVAGKGPEKIYK